MNKQPLMNKNAYPYLFIYIIKQSKIIKMNPDKLIQLPKCNINFYKLKQKAVISTGPCQIYTTATTFNIKSSQTLLQIPLKSTIVRFKQLSYSTYLFLHQNGGVYTISIPKNDQSIMQFQGILGEYLQIADLYMLPPDLQLKQKLNHQCPLNQANGPELGATNDDTLQTFGQGLGNVFGGISAIFDMDKINRQSNQAITRVSRNTFSQPTLTKWQMFKNKCSELNDKVSQAIKPVSEVCKNAVTDIGKNFDKSQNGFIKNIREYSKKTQKALNQGYQKGDAPRRASYVPPTTTTTTQTKKQETPLKMQETLNQRKSLL